MKRISALLCALLLVTLCSCGKTPAAPEETTSAPPETTAATDVTTDTPTKKVVLPYTSTDTLNPFQTESTHNHDLSTLLFDSLFRVDDMFNAIPSLATDIQLDDTTATVTLRDDIRFSNGDLLTARDVVYSFGYAKESPFYKARLLNIFNCTVSDETTVSFVLLSPNVDCANCLDFPIVKFGTATNDHPVGSGRYILKGKGSHMQLVRNEDTAANEEMEQQTISLLDISMRENKHYLLQIGDLSCLFCDPETETNRIISAHTAQIPLNNLVYLGFNSKDSVLQDPALRRAISAAVDRTALIDDIYGTNATVAETPFNPNWSKLPPADDTERPTQSAAVSAADLLNKAGYRFAYSTSTVRSKNDELLSLTFLVNEENEHRVTLARRIASALEDLGIDINLQVLSFESYQSQLQSGAFSMYLGEVKLTPDMDLSVFFDDDGALRYGIGELQVVKDALRDYRRGTIDVPTFIKVFDETLPFLPLCYRNAVMFYTRTLSYEGTGSESDVYANAYSWGIS